MSAAALEDAISMLRSDGLESSQLAIFVDLTASNNQKGAKSFGGRGLHDVSDPKLQKPYQDVIATIGRTLAPFDSDGLIPLYGFGCSHSLGSAVLPLHFAGNIGAPGSDEPKNFAKGFAHALDIYTRRIASGAIKFSGPANFAPAIRKSIELSKASGARELTICLILTCSETEARVSTEAALKDASKVPLAIVVVGVGDGPFDDMRRLDDDIGSRLFDNLNYVDLERVREDCAATGTPLATALALACLGEIPDVLAACERLGYIGKRSAAKTGRALLDSRNAFTAAAAAAKAKVTSAAKVARASLTALTHASAPAPAPAKKDAPPPPPDESDDEPAADAAAASAKKLAAEKAAAKAESEAKFAAAMVKAKAAATARAAPPAKAVPPPPADEEEDGEI